MQWDEKQVAKVAKLARLAMTPQEMGRFSGQLGNIIAYVEKLNALSTEGVEPTSHVLPIHNVFREDAASPSLPVTDTLENAPDAVTPFFRVPKIIE